MLVIHLHNMKLETVLGVYDHERKDAREMVAHLDLYVENDAACLSDRLQDTVDYDEVTLRFRQVAAAKPYYLIEHLAHSLLESLTGMAHLARAGIEIQKYGCVKGVEYTAVRLEKTYSRKRRSLAE
ncbi:FolB domain-containing protein [bacterium]|nr:FolB domain-containing protein [bacterium]